MLARILHIPHRLLKNKTYIVNDVERKVDDSILYVKACEKRNFIIINIFIYFKTQLKIFSLFTKL